VVNDATPNWGAGFGKVVQEKWPEVQRSFREAWTHSPRIRLGDVFFSSATENLTVCQLVCQRGYGPSDQPRLKYSALRDCLQALANRALEQRATIHMPRIGTGHAGGSWNLISALIDEVLCGSGLSVTVYEPPSLQMGNQRQQRGLFD
jgi:O-acetyl-ADP-ribose deacetylase (regulator of RNase III)